MNIFLILGTIVWVASVIILLIASSEKDSIGLYTPNKWVVLTIFLISFSMILFISAKGHMWHSTKYNEVETRTIIKIVNGDTVKSDTLIRIKNK
jgi:hypothetical protein